MILPLFTKGWISGRRSRTLKSYSPRRTDCWIFAIRRRLTRLLIFAAMRWRKWPISPRRGRIPLLVGGTMLYFKALLEGLSPLPSADPEVRARIEQQAAEQGWESLHRQLQEVDPVAAARIHPNDPQRLSRALEVFFISGKTLTELTQTSGRRSTVSGASVRHRPRRAVNCSINALSSVFIRCWLQVLKQKSGRFLPEEICIRTCLPFVAWVIARCGLTLKAKSHTMKWFIEVFAPRDSWRSGR